MNSMRNPARKSMCGYDPLLKVLGKNEKSTKTYKSRI